MTSIRWIGLFLCLCLYSYKNTEETTLTIAVASNMHYTVNELVNEYTKSNNQKINVVVGSSGKLTAQISEGAPFDLFISADMMYPQRLYDLGLTLGKPIVLAKGKLVLWTAQEKEIKLTDLSNESIRHIALANPQNAPYGRAAKEVLDHHNLMEKVDKKLVYGESISQTNQFILSGAADVGFTSKSVVLSDKIKHHGSWSEIDSSLYSAINQGIVLIKQDRKSPENAKSLYDYLLSDDAKEVLFNNGYELPK